MLRKLPKVWTKHGASSSTSPRDGQAPCLFGAFSKFGDESIEGPQPPEMKLRGGASSATVAVDHGARLVAGAVGDPRLGLAVGQGQRDERASEIVGAKMHALLGLAEERLALDSGSFQRIAKTLGELVQIKTAAIVHEDEFVRLRVLVKELLPEPQSS